MNTHLLLLTLTFLLTRNAKAQETSKTTITFKDALIDISLPTIWKLSKDMKEYPHLAEASFRKDTKSFTMVDVSLLRLQGKDPKKTADWLVAMEKQKGKSTGVIKLQEDKALSANSHMTHLTHSPKVPNKFQRTVDRVRIISWQAGWTFVVSCKIQAETKDLSSLKPLVKACKELKVRPKTTK